MQTAALVKTLTSAWAANWHTSVMTCPSGSVTRSLNTAVITISNRRLCAVVMFTAE